jgi:hypothetical protein
MGILKESGRIDMLRGGICQPDFVEQQKRTLETLERAIGE